MKVKSGLFAFVIVLLLMPLGHTLMVLTEELFPNSMFISAGVVGFIGLGLLVWGTLINHNKWGATILGLLAGVLVWTGWIEFSFVWIAKKLEVPPLMENGEVATKPEYLIMMSSIGLLATFGLMFFFSKTNCQFFNWFQRAFKLRSVISFKEGHEKPMALITFIELVMIVWTFYIVLLLVYDKDIAGDRHPLTYLVAFGSLFWSVYLFVQLIKIQKLDYAIRYAIPTVVIFWNFVEVLGRWDMFKEIWVHPKEHWLEVGLITACLVLFVVLYVRESLLTGRQKRMSVHRGALES
ncbi:MAG: hypothetical protein HYZ16_10840 [Bacteroidetes bacterium]|jgi:hypothetical protein|nr:hypothetical protein [Bacteroidota bacterium]